MSIVYLHIGTVKTGSSTIQKFLWDNRKILEKLGYCVPQFPFRFGAPFTNRNGHFLVHPFHEKTAQESQEKYSAVQKKAFEILAEKASQYDHMILTDEVIWQYWSQYKGFWEKLVERFAEINCKVKVIVYFRRQDLLAESIWNQRVKSFYNYNKEFSDWITHQNSGGYPMNYYTQLVKIAKYIGKENIIVRVYEKNSFIKDEQSIFHDFLSAVGLTFSEDFILENPVRNTGLYGNFIEIKRQMNEIPEYQDMNDFLRHSVIRASACINQIDPAPKCSMFSYEDRIAFLKRFEEENRKVAAEFLGRADGILFSEPVDKLPMWELNAAKMDRDLLAVMVEALCAQEKTIQYWKTAVQEMEGKMNLQQRRMERLESKSASIEQLDSQVTSMYRSPIFRAYRKVRKAVKGK